MKLGRSAKRVDPRTLRYAAMRADPTWSPPTSYSWDAEHPGIVPTPTLGNDRFGDCVKAAQAHQQMRFEAQEQGVLIPLTEQEVVEQYLLETGGADNGLVMIESLRIWRHGWKMGGKVYSIHSFLEVMPQNHDEVKEAMIACQGVQVGAALPLSASDQMNAGQPWDLVAGPRGAAGSWGGHAILAYAYDASGVEFVTWGKRQKATWRWLDAYVDECYAVVDDVDRVAQGENIDADRLQAALSML